MSRISIFLFHVLLLASPLPAQVLKIDRVVKNNVDFTIRNNTKEPVELSTYRNKMVFIEVELWDLGKGARLLPKVQVEISDGGGFVLFDSLVIDPGAKRELTINLEDYVPFDEEKNNPVFRKFLARDGTDDWHYSIRICNTNSFSSKRTEVAPSFRPRRAGTKRSDELEQLKPLPHPPQDSGSINEDAKRPAARTKHTPEKHEPVKLKHIASYEWIRSTSEKKDGELITFYLLRQSGNKARLLVTAEKYIFANVEFQFVGAEKKSPVFRIEPTFASGFPAVLEVDQASIPEDDFDTTIVVHSFSKK